MKSVTSLHQEMLNVRKLLNGIILFPVEEVTVRELACALRNILEVGGIFPLKVNKKKLQKTIATNPHCETVKV